MANEAITVGVQANTSLFEKQVTDGYARSQKYINSHPFQPRIDVSRFPLGRITNDARAFDQAIGAATTRVTAFAAAAGVFLTIKRSFDLLVSSTIEVEKELAKININLNESASGIKAFGQEIFAIARQTGQPFEAAAKAAAELSKQGLGAAETAKRLKDALTLARYAGIDSAEAVKDLTVAVNTFHDSALTTTDVLNKFIAVSRSYAGVSGTDLTEAFERVGETAQQAGVDINTLLGYVTALQRETGRGGTSIGTGLNSIFNRLSQPKFVDQLQNQGIATRSKTGDLLGVPQLLQNIAARYGSLTKAQQENILTDIAESRQVNILRALLLDLSKSYGVAAQATQTATQATEEGDRVNAELNKTLATRLQTLSTSAKQFFSAVGNEGPSGLFKGLLDSVDSVRDKLSGDNATQIGKFFGDGLVRGIGAVLSGPGIIAVLALLARGANVVFQKIQSEAASLLDIKGINQANAEVQTRINNLLSVATQQELAQVDAAGTLLAKKEAILAIATRIAEVEATTAAENSAIASSFVVRGPFGGARVDPRLNRGAAGGYNPAISSELSAISRGVGGASSSARPVQIDNFALGGGVTGPLVANTDEYMVKNFANGGSAIFNPAMIKAYGLPPGATRVGSAAGGYVPNAAIGGTPTPGFDINLRSARGSSISSADADALTKLFESVKKAGSGNEARDLGKGIIDITQGLNKASQSHVLEKLGQVYASFDNGSRLAARAGLARANDGGRRVSQEEYFAQNPISTGPDTFSLSTRAAAADAQRSRRLLRNSRDNAVNGAIERQLTANAASARIGAGESLEDLTPEQRASIVNELRRKAISKLGLDKTGASLPQILGNRNAQDQINAEISSSLASLRRPPQGEPPVLPKAQSLLRRLGGRLNPTTLAFAAPILVGFIPEEKGGSPFDPSNGKLGGVGSGLARGVANGAGTGAVFGGVGAAIGAGVGGLYGALSKLKKSTEDLSAEFDEINAKSASRTSSIQQLIQAESSLREAITSGAGPQAIERLNEAAKNAASGLDSDLLKQVQGAGGNLDQLNKILSNLNQTQSSERTNQNAAGKIYNLAGGNSQLSKTILGTNFSSEGETDKKIRDASTALAKALPAGLAKTINLGGLRSVVGGDKTEVSLPSFLKKKGEDFANQRSISFVQSQFDIAKKAVPELSNVDKIDSTNFKEVAEVIFRASVSSQKLAKELEQLNQQRQKEVGIITLEAQQFNAINRITAIAGISRSGASERTQLGIGAASEAFGFTRSQRGAIQGRADLDVGKLETELQGNLDGLKGKYEAQIKVLEAIGNSEDKVLALRQEEASAITDLKVSSDEAIKTRKEAARVEIQLAQESRRASAFRNASIGGTPELGVFGASQRYRQNQTQVAQVNRRELAQQAFAKLDELGAPENPDEFAVKQGIGNNNRLDKVFATARSFLQGRTGRSFGNGQGIFKDQITQSLEQISGDKSFDQETRTASSRFLRGINEAKQDALDPKGAEKRLKAPSLVSDFQDAMKQIKKDQDESISNTAKLLQQLGNTEIKIAANIAGTLDIVATSLSPEAVSSLKDEIIYSVSKIIDARIKGQDTPQPPSIDQRRLSSNLNRQAER